MAKIESNRKNTLYWLLIFAIFCAAVFTLKSVIMPFVAGILIGYLLDPLVTKIENIVRNRTLATLLVVISVIIILVPIVIIICSAINDQVSHFLSILPEYVASLNKKLEPILNDLQQRYPNLSAERFREYMRNHAENNLKIIANLIKRIISGGFAIINVLSLILITPIVSFYMLKDWKSFAKKVKGLLPVKHKEKIIGIMNDIDKTLAGFIRGQSGVCLFLATYYSIGLSIVGLELGFLIGFLTGIASFVPCIGGITGFAISLIVAFMQFDTMTPILHVVAVFAIGQFLENNFVTPKLVGQSIGLHPVWIMFAVLSGAVLLGFLGVMLAVPIAAVIGVLIRHAVDDYKHSPLYLDK